MVPYNKLEEVDRYALACYGETGTKILDAYERYEFQPISHTLNQFLTVHLSAFYIDVLKDRLYTFSSNSVQRRSAQTALYNITDGLTRLLAPLLPVTADDLWRFLPGKRESSVHLADFPMNCREFIDADLQARWKRLLALRNKVNLKLEELRQEKIVGTSLEASVTLRTTGITTELTKQYETFLPTLFITSDVVVTAQDSLTIDKDGTPKNSETLSEQLQKVEPHAWFTEQELDKYSGSALIEVSRAGGTKCERCWRYVNKVSRTTPTGLCDRCVGALAESVDFAD